MISSLAAPSPPPRRGERVRSRHAPSPPSHDFTPLRQCGRAGPPSIIPCHASFAPPTRSLPTDALAPSCQAAARPVRPRVRGGRDPVDRQAAAPAGHTDAVAPGSGRGHREHEGPVDLPSRVEAGHPDRLRAAGHLQVGPDDLLRREGGGAQSCRPQLRSDGPGSRNRRKPVAGRSARRRVDGHERRPDGQNGQGDLYRERPGRAGPGGRQLRARPYDRQQCRRQLRPGARRALAAGPGAHHHHPRQDRSGRQHDHGGCGGLCAPGSLPALRSRRAVRPRRAGGPGRRRHGLSGA